MVLELPVALALAVFGLGGLLLYAFVSRIRQAPLPWLGFFGGVLLFLVLHDLTDAFLLEPLLRLLLGTPQFPGIIGSFTLIALGLLVGWLLASVLLRWEDDRGPRWRPRIATLALLLALHSAVDGIAVGETLQILPQEAILAPLPGLFQILHRVLEGGILVMAMILVRARWLSTLALTLYVGLPFLVTTPWPLYAPFDIVAGVSLVLAFALLSASVTFTGGLLASAPLTRTEWGGTVPWILLGFIVTVLTHGLAH